MIRSSQIRIPIPKARNTQCKVEIAGVDVTSKVISSSWILPVTNGIGTFSISLSNAFGQISGDYKNGDVVKFYADNTDGTTLQFWGRVDYTKDDISDNGQFLNIEGRHRSFLLNEYLICHNVSGEEPGQILKDIIDKLPTSYGFTYSNVVASSTTMDAEWNYKPFWDCVVELCNKADFDCYVDDDLDFHFFEKDSIANTTNAVVEGDNFIKSSDYGTNDYYEKTRVIATGQDAAGLDIVYTAISSTEGDEIREVFIRDISANTYEKVKDLADARLLEVTGKNPQAKIISFGLDSISPGDNIWIIVPRQKIAMQYKLISIRHNFGMKIGGWRTELITEEQEAGTSSVIQGIVQKNQQITGGQNINKLNYSYNFDFDTDTGTHETTEIIRGFLKIAGGGSTGTWISPTLEIDSNATNFEFRVIGENLTDADYFVSTTAGSIWQPINDLKTYKTFSPVGKNLKIKIVLNSATSQVDSVSLLYS